MSSKNFTLLAYKKLKAKKVKVVTSSKSFPFSENLKINDTKFYPKYEAISLVNIMSIAFWPLQI